MDKLQGEAAQTEASANEAEVVWNAADVPAEPAAPAAPEIPIDPMLDREIWPLDAMPEAAAGDATWSTGSIGSIGSAESTAEDDSSVGIVGHLHNVAGPVAGVIGSVIGAASQVWSVREGLGARRLSHAAREPLANLYELYPEARQASPHELGMRFVPVEEIRGTAVAGHAQRGGDFLPLKPFRGENWEARWRRLRSANDRLQPLPPVDLIKYDGDFWVVDGHNRVAVTLYANGVGLDAMVTELVPLDGQTSERPRNLLSYLGETGELRAAASGHRPAIGMRQVEQLSADEAAVMPEDEREAQDEADAERAAEAAGNPVTGATSATSLGEAD